VSTTVGALAAGTAVALVDVRSGQAVAATAVPLVRAARAVYRGRGVGAGLAEPVPPPAELLAEATGVPVVLLAIGLDDPAAAALRDAGAQVIGPPQPPGSGLVNAVAVMDRLRSPGGCPWDAEQTHASLRRYLVEECFELLEAIEDGDRAALREELGDVLLQVLFHARVAQEDTDDPFTIDDVAQALVAKLVGRHPHVFAGGDSAVRDARTQERRWEEIKHHEKRRESSVDGVAMGQPALALAAKLAQRTARAGLPGDLLPGHPDTGARLFDLAALAALAGADPEGELRAAARRFASDVRAAEAAARRAGIDPLAMDHQTWRRFWPAPSARRG
jgi:XTP/dITP diphosphohydrolase